MNIFSYVDKDLFAKNRFWIDSVSILAILINTIQDRSRIDTSDIIAEPDFNTRQMQNWLTRPLSRSMYHQSAVDSTSYANGELINNNGGVDGKVHIAEDP
jgi:hypothetical protein